MKINWEFLRSFSRTPVTGGEIRAEIKEIFENSRIPVVLISDETDIGENAKKCGTDGYIPKPFDIVEMQIKQLMP